MGDEWRGTGTVWEPPIQDVGHPQHQAPFSTRCYVQERYRYDGADVVHLVLKKGHDLDWRRLLMRMDRDWELLYAHLLNFRFIYPSQRESVPDWLMDELASRLHEHRQLPTPQDRVCRGRLLTRYEYQIDIEEWGFKYQ